MSTVYHYSQNEAVIHSGLRRNKADKVFAGIRAELEKKPRKGEGVKLLSEKGKMLAHTFLPKKGKRVVTKGIAA